MLDFKPALRQIQYLLRLWDEHGNQLLGSLNFVLRGMVAPIQTDMIEVAGRFENQVRQLLAAGDHPEGNELLQERIRPGLAQL